MAVIRVVLSVVLAVALLGIGLSAGERVERDRNAAIAIDELETIADRALALASDNDPVDSADEPAVAIVVVATPKQTFTDGGRLYVADDQLAWRPATGPNRTVDSSVSLRVDAPIEIADRTRLRLSLVRSDEGTVIHVERADTTDTRLGDPGS